MAEIDLRDAHEPADVAAVGALARAAGYRTVRLDTLHGRMDTAEALYRSLGFRETPPYCVDPLPEVTYYALDMSDAA